ncbi:ABC transporter ATP-binding protein [Microbispora triticiradicis]|uniref:ABC transporter ATP-binding protein n=2 Tax=Microbispora TaxID=2005 RepID=A0ABY3LQI6_9ACTN|nr:MULTISPECIES: ABC transporter ATP-binding protein [Microbispora]TLP55157.1 ABC transporter ATP-binding protein [Microbispora fusca]TYB50187.1 ABC transporter ATP-binding protein [Microbispora tritici]
MASPQTPGPVHSRSSWRSLWRLRTYLRPYAGSLVVSWFAALGGIAAGTVIPLVGKEIIDGPVAHGDLAGLVPLGLLALGLGVTEALLTFVRRWSQAGPVLGLETAIRDDLYRRLQRLPMSFHDGWQSGQLLSRATSDLSTIRRFLGFGVLFLIMNILQLTAVTVVLLRMYWPLGLLVAASALPVVALSLRFERRYIGISRRLQDQQGDLATLVEESAVGVRTVKAFGRREHVFGGYAAAAREVRRTALGKVRLASRFFTFLEVVPNVTLALVLLLGAIAVGAGALTLGTLVAFTTLVLQLVWPVASLGYILAMGQEAMTSADRVVEVLDTVPAIRGGADVIERPRGHVRFEGVEFRFPGADRPVLRDVWLEVRPGETVAVVGATGSGKTTLTTLVPRLCDVTAGRVTIDGHDVRHLSLASLRSVVATAFEEPTLFSMSVRENVTLGRGDATEEEIRQALEISQATFAYDLPWGLDTRIGEQGMSLSGGQRQRLALARAVLGRPRVLVLDDTLSALDVETEALVEEALRRVLADATGIVVAHRASTVLLADRVALLRDGTIAHVGRHGDLLATVPEYRELLAQDAGLDAERSAP